MSEYDIMDDLGWYDDSMPPVVVEMPVEPVVEPIVEMPAKINFMSHEVHGPYYYQHKVPDNCKFITRTVDADDFNNYFGYECPDTRNAHSIELMHKGLEVHERCTGLRRFKAFLDLDCAADASDSSIDAIIEAMNFLLFDDDLSIARIDRTDKRSLHVVSKTEYMSGMVAYGKFLTDMVEYLELNEHYESVAHIDKIKSS